MQNCNANKYGSLETPADHDSQILSVMISRCFLKSQNPRPSRHLINGGRSNYGYIERTKTTIHLKARTVSKVL